MVLGKIRKIALTTCFYTVRGGAINKKEAGWKTGPPCYFYQNTFTKRSISIERPTVKVIAVEPATSPVLNGGQSGPHKIQGIGAGFIPETYSSEYIDEVLDIQNDDAIKAGRELAQTEGLLVGISSGAAAFAATEIAKRPENKGKKIVALLPDTGERYLSTVLYAFEEYPL